MRINVLLLLGLFSASTVGAAPAIHIGPDADPLVRDAAVDLQRWLRAADLPHHPIEIGPSAPASAEGIVLGTPESLPALPETWPFGLEVPSADGYIMHAVGGRNRLIAIAAPQPEGVQNGVYGLLEALGFGFYPSETTVPKGLDLSKLPAIHESVSPALAVRGLMPQFGLFDSMSVWNPADYQMYIDQLVRMRLNMLVVYAPPGMPFVDYGDGGQPLPRTGAETYATEPLQTGAFHAGTGAYFGQREFGADSSLEPPAQATAAAQRALSESLAYARSRGLRTGLGLAVFGNPFDPVQQEAFSQRVRNILTAYPHLDTLWLWAPEDAARLRPGAPRHRSPMAQQLAAWEAELADTPREQRQAVARLGVFAQQAKALLDAIRPDVRLVAGGWGGHPGEPFADLLPALDRVVDSATAVTATGSQPLAPEISGGFARVDGNRTLWPALHLEAYDAPWIPQMTLGNLAAACRDVQAKGADGVFGVHWRLRSVDEPAAFLARFTWDPELTAEAFLEQRIDHLYGPELAEVMRPIHQALHDGAAYAWQGGLERIDASGFVRMADAEAVRGQLVGISAELRAVLGEDTSPVLQITDTLTGAVTGVAGAVSGVADTVTGITGRIPGLGDVQRRLTQGLRLRLGQDPTALEPVRDLYTYIQFLLAYDAAAKRFTTAALPEPAEARSFVETSGLPGALHAYAAQMRTRTELGALAQMNVLSWARLRDYLELEGVQGLEALPPLVAREPRLIGLPGRVIRVGGGELAEMTLHIRPMGSTSFTTQPLPRQGEGTFRIEWPEGDETVAYEYGVTAPAGLGKTLAYPEGFPRQTASITRFAPTEATISEPTAPAPAPPLEVTAAVDSAEGMVTLTWTPHPGHAYTIERSGTVLARVFGGRFVDAGPPSASQVDYRIVPVQLATDAPGTSASVQVAIPELPLPNAPESVRLSSRAGLVVLGWQSDSPHAAEYVVTRYGGAESGSVRARVPADYGHYLQVGDTVPDDQPYSYTVTPIAPDGRAGTPSGQAGIFTSARDLAPVVQLSYDDADFLDGLAALTANHLAVGGSGWEALPAQPAFQPTRELTMALWVRLDDLRGQPVFLCKGPWEASGYYLQGFGGQLRFGLAGLGVLDGGALEAGRWQHLAATYSNGEMRLYIDGQPVARRRAADTPEAAAWDAGAGDVVRGSLDRLRVYDECLTGAEIQALADASRPAATS